MPLGWSGGSRRFSFQAPLTVVLPAGGYVLLTTDDGARYLGQILDRAILERSGPSFSPIAVEPTTSATRAVTMRRSPAVTTIREL